MIRVKVDIVPFGMEEHTKAIGDMIIANTNNLGLGLCEYHAVFLHGDGEITRVGPVKHSRQAGFWSLINTVLEAEDSESDYNFSHLEERLQVKS